MTSKFATAMASAATTWNGAVSLATPDSTEETSGRIGLFFKTVRGLDESRLYEYMSKASKENLTDTFILAFYIRDCRGGKGERDLGRNALIWLFLSYPVETRKVLSLLPEYGRWDDLLFFFPSVLNLSDYSALEIQYNVKISDINVLLETQLYAVNIFATQLRKDLAGMNEGLPISIAAKWAPTERDSLDRKHNTVETLQKALGLKIRQYRKELISPLRTYLKIVEKFMCEQNWDSIEFSKVPSCAIKRLKKAFEKHTPALFNEWKEQLKKGEEKVNAKQLFPHELVHEVRFKGTDEICEAQWKVLEEETLKLGYLADSLVMVDSSGSMLSQLSKSTANCLDVAMAIGLLVAHSVQGTFHNHVLSFSTTPQFTVLQDGLSLADRCRTLAQMSWSMSTNLQGAFDLILDKAGAVKLAPEEMPKRIFIVSDMQFDNACDKRTNFQVITDKYKQSGYSRPQLVFWNVNGASTDFPVSVGDDGTAMISGFSTSIMKAVLTGKDFTPYGILRTALDSDRYNSVKNSLV